MALSNPPTWSNIISLEAVVVVLVALNAGQSISVAVASLST